MKKTILSLLLLLITTTLIAQNEIKCGVGNDFIPKEDLQAYVDYKQNKNKTNRFSDTLIVPIVVHNLHWNYSGYLPDSLILQSIDKVNDALANRGDYYDPLGVDMKVRIKLANIDPYGNATTGIIHKQHKLAIKATYISDPIFDENLQWDRKRYLNVYLCENQGGISQFPWREKDNKYSGVLIHSAYFPSKKGIIVWVHEIGHYLGLFHTFNYIDSWNQCLNDDCLRTGDGICDTPPEKGLTKGCIGLNTCHTDVNLSDTNNLFVTDQLDMVDNYMAASPCRSRFTQGQKETVDWIVDYYRIEIITSADSVCLDCPSLVLDFEKDKEYAYVGDEVVFTNKNVRDDVVYVWYVEDVYYGDGASITVHGDSAAVIHVKLEAYLKDYPACSGKWSLEKDVYFRCNEDGLHIDQPDYYVIDSCYEITVSGIEVLSWQYGEVNGAGGNIDICIKNKPTSFLKITYENKCGIQTDSLLIVPHASSKKQIKYYEMSVYEDTLKELIPGKLTKIGFDKFIHSGSIEGKRDFVRFLYPNANVNEDWQIHIKDSLTAIHIRQAYQDESGGVYFMGQYANTTLWGSLFGYRVVGKLNAFGQVVWAKKIKKYKFYTIHWKDMIIEPVGDNLLLRYSDLFWITKDGDLQNLISYESLPFNAFGGNLNGVMDYGYSNEKIWFTGDIFTSEVNVDGSKNVYFPLLIGVMDKNGKNVAAQRYRHDTINKIRHNVVRGSIAISPISDNEAIVFWQSDFTHPNNNGGDPYIHLAKVNDKGEIMWQKAWQFSEDPAYTQTYIHVKKNGEFTVVFNVYRNNDVLEVKMDFSKDGELLTKLVSSGDRIGPAKSSGIVDSDGLLKQYDGKYVNILRHIPFNNDYYNCDTSALEFYPVEENILVDTSYKGIAYEELSTTLEDIDIYITKSYSENEILCDTVIDLEDYSIVVKDTNYICPDSVEVSLEICRTDWSVDDYVLLLSFDESPIDTQANLLHNEFVPMEQGIKCKTVSFVEEIRNLHYIINAKPDIITPYTLQTNFFDANIRLESDYTNNYINLYRECETSVQEKNKVNQSISIFPNPTEKILHIQSKRGRMKQILLYNTVGQLVLSEKHNTFSSKIDMRALPSGVYFLEVLMDDNTRMWEKISR